MIQDSKKLSMGIARAIHGRSVPNNLRSLVAIGSFEVSLEHHRAVILTVAKQFFGSAFSLLRPMFESCIVGLWAAHIADESQIKEFNNRRYHPKPEKVLRALAKNSEKRYVAALKAIHDSGYQALHEFVHGGISQLTRRTDGSNIGPHYPREMIESLLHVLNVIAAISATQLADLTQDGAAGKGLDVAIDRYFEKRA